MKLIIADDAGTVIDIFQSDMDGHVFVAVANALGKQNPTRLAIENDPTLADF